jgi:hypothetical protein
MTTQTSSVNVGNTSALRSVPETFRCASNPGVSKALTERNEKSVDFAYLTA